MSWSELAARMDSIVDERLGDPIEYAANGTAFVPMKGFVVMIVDAFTDTDADEVMGSRKAVKINKSLIPFPADNHRLKVPGIGPGTFAPMSVLPDEDDRYYVFHVRKAS